MKTILYSTDCSEHDAPTLQYVYQLSHMLKATLAVLHIYDIPPVSGPILRTPDQLKRLTHQEKKEILASYCSKHLKSHKGNDRFKLITAYGASISKAILLKSEELQADIVVLGMKDEHTKRGFFSGNIANAMLKKITCPLMIIPNGLPYKRLNKLVYATDFEMDDIFAIQKLVSIFAPHEADIKVVHVPVKGEYSGKQQMAWFEDMLVQKVSYKNIDFQIIPADTVDQGLRMFIENEKADLIAMLEREEDNFFKKLFQKDTIEKMETEIKIPLLSINTKSIL